MADAGDGQTLLGGSRGEQRACTAEQDLFQLSGAELTEKIAAEGNGTAAAAGTAGMHILFCIVENQGSAIRQLSAEGYAIPLGQLHQHFLAQLTQITGDDQIKILWGFSQIVMVE